MAGSVEDELYSLTNEINRLVKLFGGTNGNSPFTSSKSPLASNLNTKTATKGGKRITEHVAGHVSGVLKKMHSSVDDFTDGLMRATKGIVELTVLVELFESAMKIGKTFNKLTDIGQSFGGSMFTMMQQAGAAGLSLEQYSDLLSRNSVVSKMMGNQFEATTDLISASGKNVAKSMTGTKTGLGQLQLTVRDDLKNVGFFGMTMGELANTTSDYAETLRQTGMLSKLNSNQQAKAVDTLIRSTSELSQVFGTSREQIIKTTNDSMRQVNFATRLSLNANQGQAEAGQKWISFFSSLPGQSGQKMAQAFAEQGGRQGFIDNDLLRGFITTGLGSLTDQFDAAINDFNHGQAPTAKRQADMLATMYDTITENAETLSQYTHTGGNPEVMRAAADQLQLRNDLRTYVKNGVFDKAAYMTAAKKAEEQAKINDRITQTMLTFHDTVERITSSFRNKFYGAFAREIGGPGSEKMDKILERLGDLFGQVGDKLGVFLGTLLQPANIDRLIKGFGYLADTVETVIHAFAWVAKGFKSLTKSLGGSDNTATIVAIVAPLAIAWFVKSFLTRLVHNITGGFIHVITGALGAGSGLGAVARSFEKCGCGPGLGAGAGIGAAGGEVAGGKGKGAAKGAGGAGGVAAPASSVRSRAQLGVIGRIGSMAAGILAGIAGEKYYDSFIDGLTVSAEKKELLKTFGDIPVAILSGVVGQAVTSGLLRLGANVSAAILPALAEGAAGFAATLGGLGVLAGVSIGAKAVLEGGSDWIMDKIFGPGYAKKAHEDLAQGNPFSGNIPNDLKQRELAEKTREQLEKNRRDRGNGLMPELDDGYGVDGLPVKPALSKVNNSQLKPALSKVNNPQLLAMRAPLSDIRNPQMLAMTGIAPDDTVEPDPVPIDEQLSWLNTQKQELYNKLNIDDAALDRPATIRDQDQLAKIVLLMEQLTGNSSKTLKLQQSDSDTNKTDRAIESVY